ncbi:MAG: hypothetical protein ACRD0X_04400 [Thermoanaerobaculia bacterium]
MNPGAGAARYLEMLLQAGVPSPPETFRARVDGCVAALARACLLETDNLRLDLDEEATPESLLVPERVGQVLYLLSNDGDLGHGVWWSGWISSACPSRARPGALSTSRTR